MKFLRAKVPTWLFAVMFVWAMSTTYFWQKGCPAFIPDNGHRCFGVKNENAAVVLGGIIRDIGGLGERFTFSPGDTTQTVFSDNTTVLIQHDSEDVLSGKIPANAISLVVDDTEFWSAEAVKRLKDAGFTAELFPTPKFDEDKLVLIKTDAFLSTNLVLRLHVWHMGDRPGLRKILD